MFWFEYKLPFFLKSLNLPIIFTSVVRIHLDGDFSDIVPLPSSLFTITSYLPKILVDKRKVKSEKEKVKIPVLSYEDFWLFRTI